MFVDNPCGSGVEVPELARGVPVIQPDPTTSGSARMLNMDCVLVRVLRAPGKPGRVIIFGGGLRGLSIFMGEGAGEAWRVSGVTVPASLRSS